SVTGGGIETTLELLPAMAMSCTAVTDSTGKSLIANYWLDVRKDDLKNISNVQYDLGPGFDNRYVTAHKIQPSNYYADKITIFAPQAIKARINLASGSTLSLSTFCAAQPKEASTALEHYFLADVYYWADKPEDAYREIRASREKDAAFPPAAVLEANILGK